MFVLDAWIILLKFNFLQFFIGGVVVLPSDSTQNEGEQEEHDYIEQKEDSHTVGYTFDQGDDVGEGVEDTQKCHTFHCAKDEHDGHRDGALDTGRVHGEDKDDIGHSSPLKAEVRPIEGIIKILPASFDQLRGVIDKWIA